MPGNGGIVDVRKLVDNGHPSKRYDIVILGDGFQAWELAKFDGAAKLLTQKLLAMPPFDSVAHLINVHAVRAFSTDSGVSNFPERNTPRNTFYNVTGFFRTQEILDPPRTFLGTPTPEKVIQAAQLVAPAEMLQLYIVLANVDAFAFSAHPASRMVFAGVDQPERVFINYSAHECCHVIALTAEEYQDCNPPPPGRKYPNQMTEAQRIEGRLKWEGLATSGEIKRDGSFKAVNLFSDTDVTFDNRHSPVSSSRPELRTMLGLYWQCQDVDLKLDGECATYGDPRGRFFYRPMGACKMRHPWSDFCRVCADAIVRGIKDNLR